MGDRTSMYRQAPINAGSGPGRSAGKGHGRFWVGPGFVVITHRITYALNQRGLTWMPAVVAHACDNPICQNPTHLHASDPSENRSEWAARRHTLASPLRDAAGDGHDITAILAVGARCTDQDRC
ncbi:hypothetical protein EQW78_11815 [Oerskovia turbata]|uniref:HNH nuclease domain-containing protein n=1 Tax=Oerskovia turbata TaxID=1713 RepID=A0A4Q1KVI9_9CELL|nr:hypothetical protein [Oerskovia turbata]RXR25883.1 hypothetical protein EQW73_10355 [Oerskovia turbata]RXR33449.1 hypothetical protein EQW78_11815 [Oerskovia turbata]